MDDLISRAAACDEIGNMIHEYREKGDHDLADALILLRRYVLKRLPTIDAIPVEWLVSWINRHPNDLRCAWFASLEMEWQKEQEAR